MIVIVIMNTVHVVGHSGEPSTVLTHSALNAFIVVNNNHGPIIIAICSMY